MLVNVNEHEQVIPSPLQPSHYYDLISQKAVAQHVTLSREISELRILLVLTSSVYCTNFSYCCTIPLIDWGTPSRTNFRAWEKANHDYILRTNSSGSRHPSIKESTPRSSKFPWPNNNYHTRTRTMFQLSQTSLERVLFRSSHLPQLRARQCHTSNKTVTTANCVHIYIPRLPRQSVCNPRGEVSCHDS